ncbi:MAG TPA: hypothetical protein VLL31_01280 [Sulfurovum sp.]|nr:hypothetical protein [Sulfurovum sp.]
MLVNIILLFLFAALPYYLFFEKTKKLNPEKIFLVTVFLLLSGMAVASFTPFESSRTFIIIALISSIFSIYKATKTSNLYKLSYYMLFINAPVLFMFDLKQSVPYVLSLMVTLFGIYLIGKYYERNYGSANYHSVTGITLITPYAGLALRIYIITLALYPPFPNSIFFLNSILKADIGILWYLVVVVIFFGNFILAMRILAQSVFGKPNDNLHYVDLASKDKKIHFVIILTLFLLSIWGFKEALA